MLKIVINLFKFTVDIFTFCALKYVEVLLYFLVRKLFLPFSCQKTISSLPMKHLFSMVKTKTIKTYGWMVIKVLVLL